MSGPEFRVLEEGPGSLVIVTAHGRESSVSRLAIVTDVDEDGGVAGLVYDPEP